MKKAFAHKAAQSRSRQPSIGTKLRYRLAGGLVIVALVGTLGVVSARSGRTTTGAPVPVQIANNSVSIRDVDNPAIQPVQFALAPSSVSSSIASDSHVVPAGKRLVIEYICAKLTQYPQGGYASATLKTIAGGDPEYYGVIPQIASTDPQNQPVRIYADAGTSVIANVAQSSGTSCGAYIIVSGYYVNVP